VVWWGGVLRSELVAVLTSQRNMLTMQQQQHQRDSSFGNHEGECGESGMVAFATEQELRDHQLERHSNKMPWFKK
jgi:hypothetical protein